MYLKQLAAFGMSAVMMLSGGVVASGAETKATVDTVTPQEYTSAVEKLAANGVVSGSTTALQAGDGLRPAQASGLLDGEDPLSLTELAAQALIRETEALQTQNFLDEYDGILTICENYVTLREEPSQDAAALRTIWAGKAAHLLDVEGDWYKVSYGTSTGYVMRSTASWYTTPTTRAPTPPARWRRTSSPTAIPTSAPPTATAAPATAASTAPASP